MIKLTAPNLPNKDIFVRHVDDIFSSKILTNNGPKVEQLEQELSSLSGCKHTILMSNGTVTLYALLKSLPRKGKVITTPFTYIATTSAIVEAGHTPIFCDIDPNSVNIGPAAVEKLLDEDVVAIVPVHCYGNHCDVEGFAQLSSKHNVPVFYDAAHAFCGKHYDKSILSFGSASSVSFHATKVFNCFEGGAIFTNCDDLAESMRARQRFGLDAQNKLVANSLNFKLSEIHAAMGLSLLPSVSTDQIRRLDIYETYVNLLPRHATCILLDVDLTHSIPYLPIISDNYSAEQLEQTLQKNSIMSRRYFNPPLNEYFEEYFTKDLGLSNTKNLCSAVLCLPFHHELNDNDIAKICDTLA